MYGTRSVNARPNRVLYMYNLLAKAPLCSADRKLAIVIFWVCGGVVEQLATSQADTTEERPQGAFS